MKRLISAGIFLMCFCGLQAQVSDFLHPPKDAYPQESGVTEKSHTNPLWWSVVGKAYSDYAARYEVMNRGESDADLSALTLSEGLQCVHRRNEGRDVYIVTNPTDEALKVVAAKDKHKRNANIYNLTGGSIRGMIPSPDSRGVYREVTVCPGEAICIVFEKYNAPRMKVYDGESVFAEIKDMKKDVAAPGSVRYSAMFDVAEKKLRKERNIGNRFVVDMGDADGMAFIVGVNGKERADTVWCAPYTTDITDRLQAGENELTLTVISPEKDSQNDAASLLQESIKIKLLRQKQILEITKP